MTGTASAVLGFGTRAPASNSASSAVITGRCHPWRSARTEKSCSPEAATERQDSGTQAPGALLHQLEGHTVGPVPGRVAFTPDGSRLFTNGPGTNTGTKIWDARTGALVSDLKLDLPRHSILFSPDGARVAVALPGLKIADSRTGQTLLDFTGKASGPAASFSPDGVRFVTSGQKVKVWDAHTGAMLLEFTQPGSIVTNAAAPAPTGRA